MRRPSMEHLPAELAAPAREVAEVLAKAGYRAWLVGGAVRDLALGVAPKDADLASAAEPSVLESLFPSTHAVGRAFGTVVVRHGAEEVQVTTFRAESSYDDARRPSSVRFSSSPEEDAARRDFTCNALYLDPSTNELLDPTGGLSDLEAGRLRCVGEPDQRFAEDGLRLLRLARFAAGYGLVIEPATRAAARASLAALRGVSPERVLQELIRMAEGANPAQAAEILFGLGILGQLPGLGESVWAASLAGRVAALKELEGGGGERFFGTLLLPREGSTPLDAMEALAALRPPRRLQVHLARVFELVPELGRVLEGLECGEVPRSRWVRLVRAAEYPDAFAIWKAWHENQNEAERSRLALMAGRLSESERWPEPWITSDELQRAGVPRGARWGTLLRAAEEAQLDGEIHDRPSARAWLEARAKTPS